MTRADRDKSTHPPAPLTDRVDQACDRFEAAWVAGARPKIEDYLPATPGPEKESYFHELLVLELAYRRRDGGHPTYAEYAARFPQHLTAIAALFGMPGERVVESATTDRAMAAPTDREASPAVPARLTLEVTAGPHKGLTFSFEEHDSFIVGRSPQAHFRLPNRDSHFSRIHFLIEFNPPHCRLMDMQSTNGTLVNGKTVSRADLRDGDVIQGGTTIIRVALEPLGANESALQPTVTYRGAPTADVTAPAIAPASKREYRPTKKETIRRPKVGSRSRGRRFVRVVQGL